MNPFKSLTNLFSRRKGKGTAVTEETLEILAKAAALVGDPNSAGVVALLKARAISERALKAEQEKRWQEAIEAWSTILEAGEALPDELRAKVLGARGRVFAFAKNYKRAHDDFESGLAIEPDNAGLWGCKAVLLFAEEKYQEALEAAKHAAKLDPDDENAKLVLSRLAALQSTAISEETLESVARMAAQQDAPSSTVDLIEAGAAGLRAGKAEQEERWQEAIEAWSAVLLKGGQTITDGDRAQVLKRRSLASAKLKRYKQALDDLENALSLVQDRADLWSAKAAVLLLEGRNEKALEAVRRAVVLDKNDDTAKGVLMRLVQLGVIPTIDTE